MTEDAQWDAPTAPEPKPGKPKWVVALIVVACVVGAFTLAWAERAARDDAAKTPAPAAVTVRTVTYMVTGDHTNQASITYETPSGTGQQSDIDLPLTRKSDGGQGILLQFQAGAFLYISAQNSNDSGSVACTITVDGVVIAHNTSSGGYAIASCKGDA